MLLQQTNNTVLCLTAYVLLHPDPVHGQMDRAARLIRHRLEKPHLKEVHVSMCMQDTHL